ncbi:hypothetical protein B0191_04230 [Leptospira interrogans serovar Hardjo]|nr:hypothetical protein B0191_04230 [Leptospira interrogans serovar Hardjo]
MRLCGQRFLRLRSACFLPWRSSYFFFKESIFKQNRFSIFKVFASFLPSMFIPILKRMKRPTKTINFLNFSSFRILCGFRVLW